MLILPTILFILIIGGGVALATWINSRDWSNETIVDYVIVGVAVIGLIVLVLVPFIRWRTEHFVITNHHVFFRSGLLRRREHQIPLGQIANMETEVTFWGRLMGYGSLIVESSADQPLKFRNVASLSKVQAQLNQLIRDEREATHRRDDGPAGGYPHQGGPAQGGPGYPPQGYPAGLPGGHRSRSTRPQGQPPQSHATAGLPAAGISDPARLRRTQGYRPPPGLPASARRTSRHPGIRPPARPRRPVSPRRPLSRRRNPVPPAPPAPAPGEGRPASQS